jgi:hypothetical protein
MINPIIEFEISNNSNFEAKRVIVNSSSNTKIYKYEYPVRRSISKKGRLTGVLGLSTYKIV